MRSGVNAVAVRDRRDGDRVAGNASGMNAEPDGRVVDETEQGRILC